MDGEEKLISKKEVLERMGISYGQLYRWRRKGLIPEDWFVRRSTFTGQETFFPEERILERIAHVKSLKEEHALDELAGLIKRKANAKLEVTLDRLRKLDWWDERLCEMCRHPEPPVPPEPPSPGGKRKETISLNAALCVAALRRLRDQAGAEEEDLAKRTLEAALAGEPLEALREKKVTLYLLRKHLRAAGIQADISLAAVASSPVTFDPETEVVQSVDLGAVLERIQLELGKEEA